EEPVYRVYDPQGGRASSLFTPSSSFAEGSSGGVIETFAPPPLTIDGATGEVVSSLSRSLTVGDLVDGLGKFMSVDNPIGLTILGATTLLPLATSIYDDYESANTTPSGCTEPYSTYCSSNWGHTTGCDQTINEGSSNGSTLYACSSSSDPSAACGSFTCDASTVPTSPSNLPLWIQNNWSSDDLANDASSALQANPSYSPDLASQLANNNTPLSSPVPYSYSPSSNTLSGSPTSTSSTNPSTGDTTTTTTTPTYKVSPGTDGGLSVQKSTSSVTQTCTSSGSCTTTNTSTSTSTPQPASPFVAPTTSTPAAPSPSIKSFALNLAMPSQSDAVCPDPLSFTALSNNFTIPLTPLCSLASDVKPYVESLGAVGAGIIIFR
ncbi:virulence factor TspB C-terminal domain-related protein, partial [Acidithiobacillus marinus]|uniref:virulence factor TspB C-terminal domain-related protein n=1 Tax=Acidithiobacillus marinus TaxID=187490 RepID=UPI001C0EBD1A